MHISYNIHPDGKWEKVSCRVYGEGGGNCVNMDIVDDTGNISYISIHYQGASNRKEFVSMFKEAVSKLKEE